jgi:hypothetical protein
LSKIDELKEKNKESEGKIVTLLVEHSDDKKALKGQVEHLQNQLNEVRKVPWNVPCSGSGSE